MGIPYYDPNFWIDTPSGTSEEHAARIRELAALLTDGNLDRAAEASMRRELSELRQAHINFMLARTDGS